MKRTFLIARREYVAYAKTVGFWLSLLALPLFGVLGGGIPYLIERSEPVRQVAIVETTTGAGLAEAVTRSFNTDRDREATEAMSMAAMPEGGEAGSKAVREAAEANGYAAGLAEMKRVAPQASQAFTRPKDRLTIQPAPVDVAAAATDEARQAAIRTQLGDAETEAASNLSAIVILDRVEGAPTASVWSARAADNTVRRAIEDALTEVHRDEAMRAAGVDPGVVNGIRAFRPEVTAFSPRSATGGEVSFRDQLPGIIGFALGFILWSLIITGATILMNSVMEEKANRILEVLLSSASATEIMAGKVLGVALLTATMLVVWGGLGLGGLAAAFPETTADIISILMGDGLFIWLLIYLVGGYLMYAVVFAAIGAFCETPRDAQTLMGPIMMILVVPLIVMQMAIRNPDGTVVKVLSWIPLFTPFLMTARSPTGVAVVEHLAVIAGMGLTMLLMIWLSGRAFRAGALSDAKLSWKGILGAVRGGA